MNLTSLDVIVRRRLLERGLPIHYYASGLVYSATCLRELTFDTLQIVNTKLLTLDSYNAIDLPNDFTDEVMVGVPASGRIQPVPKISTINPLRNFSDDFQFVPYTNTDETQVAFGFIPSAMWFWNMNEWGEPTGRYFGAGGGAKANGYQVFRDRGQIQFTEQFTSSTAILIYISDGQDADNASKIDTRAFATIDAFITWKESPNRDNKNSPEAKLFSNEKRKLRSRIDQIDKTTLINIVRRNYMAASKQ